MTRKLQLLRGTTAQNDAFTGSSGELTVDTTTNELRLHDGSTAGGHTIYNKSDVDTALSGKANVATTLAGYGITDGANIDLSNLTDTGANIANWSHNATNCITEIPQDIKLELSSGTLTLKAGSKCYLKTDTTTPSVNVASDLTTTQSTNGTYFAIYNGSGLTTVLTTTYDYSSLPSTYSFPLALITVSGGTISSIDQVFNGFGYIGTAIFALPGVKGLIPNGRNADGTLKNKAFTLSSVIVVATPGTGNRVLILNPTDNSMLGRVADAVYISDTKPTVTSTAAQQYWFNPAENIIYKSVNTGVTWTQNDTIFAGTYILSTTFTSFKVKKAFKAIDYGDTQHIAHQAMPSDKSINLTLGASGNNYTMRDDGYLAFSKTTSAANQYVVIRNTTAGTASMCWTPVTNNECKVHCAVSKGDTCQVSYTAGGSTEYFKFIYANGAE